QLWRAARIAEPNTGQRLRGLFQAAPAPHQNHGKKKRGLGPEPLKRPRRSVDGGLRHRPHRSCWSVERVVDLIKGEALGFGTEYPEADQADHTPRRHPWQG